MPLAIHAPHPMVRVLLALSLAIAPSAWGQDTEPLADAPATPPSEDTTASPPPEDAAALPLLEDAAASPPLEDAAASPPLEDAAASPLLEDAAALPLLEDAATSPPPGDAIAMPPLENAATLPLPGEPPAPPLPDASTSPLFWSQEERIVGFRNFDNIYDTRPIDHGEGHLVLAREPKNFEGIFYRAGNDTHPLEHYLETYHIAGLIAVRGNDILFERYRLGHHERSRWVSFSVAKSVTSMLIGAAIQDGYIASVDEPITNYLPRLRGTPYDRSTIKNVLQMASGVAWDESYTDPESDVANAGGLNGIALYEYLSGLPGDAEPGTKFNYNTGETNLAGALLRAAIGNNASSYLEDKIWRPMMEHPATWSISSGVELGGCCIHATLRDYARLGIFAMRDGVLPDGTRVLPEGWMWQSTQASQGYDGYGYLWWLWKDEGTYAARGIFGQLIWIDPANELVIVTHGAWPAATGSELSMHQMGVVRALAQRALL